jgi:hypothetical protein
MKKTGKIRFLGAWILGIASFFLFSVSGNFLMDKIGVPLYMRFSDPVWVMDYDGNYEEKFGEATGAGLAFYPLILMVSARLGMAVNAGKIGGGVSKKGNIQFFTAALGVTLYGIWNTILFSIFHGTESGFLSVIWGVAKWASFYVIFFLCLSWSNKKIKELKNETME